MRTGYIDAKVREEVWRYTEQDRLAYEDMWNRWRDCGRMDTTVWGPYEELVTSGRFDFQDRITDGPRYYFGEAFVARQLETEGYRCWGTSKPFKSDTIGGRFHKETEAYRELIRAAARPLPHEYASRVNFEVRNPDICAWHPAKGFRFVEVKTNTSRNRPDQLRSLALLAHLLEAQVSVVRPIPEEWDHGDGESLDASFTLF